MMRLISALIVLFLASNLWAITLDSAQLQKSLSNSHHLVHSTTASYFIFYGGEDIAPNHLQIERTRLKPLSILG